MYKPLTTFTKTAIRRGLIGGQAGWRLVLLIVGGYRLFRFLGNRRSVPFRAEVAQGESLLVRHIADSETDKDS